MFGFCPLASGSKGNCLYVGSKKKTRILIDAGLPVSTILNRLQEIDIDPETIQAILVTHEHSDHIKGLLPLSQELGVPVLANAETAKGIVAAGMRPKFKIFTTGESFQFGDMTIHPFSVPHDTLDPVGFTIQMDGLKLGICADVGHITSLIRKHLELCDYLYIEANHQPSMVHASARPQILKQRILGRQGHLSNQDCGVFLASIFHAGLKQVHLAHLSSECNTAEVALKVVQEALQGKPLNLSIAYQDRVSKPALFLEE
jgi:phosphoribosyl 1,2-cyclic phosphodiesterase